MKKDNEETVKCSMLKDVGDAKKGDVVELDRDTADKYVSLGLAEVADQDGDEEQPADEDQDAEKRLNLVIEKSVAKMATKIAGSIETSVKKIPAQPKDHDSKNPEENFWVAVGRTAHPDQEIRTKAYNVLAQQYGQKSIMDQGSATTGGWLVPVEYKEELLRVDGYEPGAFDDIRRVPTSVRTMNFPALDQTVNPDGQGSSAFYGGVQIGIVSEGTAPSNNTQPAFKQVQLVVKKCIATAQVSNELVYMSPISVDAMLNELFRGATYAWAQWMIFNGAGNSTSWTGILNSPATISVPRENAGEIGLVDLANVYAKMSPVSRKRAKFYVNAAAIGQFPLVGNGYQLPMLMPKGAQSEMMLAFLGREIVPVECLPSLGTAGDLVLADLKSYIAAIGYDVRVEASPHFAFTSDLTTYRLTFMADAKPQLTAPIYLQNGVDQVSPFVMLGATGS
jgi:HK97 family phage major capsid protein